MSNVVDMRRQMKLRLVEDCQRMTSSWREDLARKEQEHELAMVLDHITEELRFVATKLRETAGKHLAAQRTRAVYQDVFGE